MIEHLAVQGYRLFRDFETDLQPGINVLIGANASGKSTLAEALGILHSCAQGPLFPGLEERRAMGDPFHPAANGQITFKVQFSVPDAAPDGNTTYTYAIRIKGAYPPVISAEEVWRPRAQESCDPVKRALVREQEAELRGGGTLMSGEEQYRILRASAGEGEMAERDSSNAYHLGPNETVLSLATDRQHFPQCCAVRNAAASWRFFTQIRVDRDSQQRVGTPLGGETQLDSTGANLLSVLLALMTNVQYGEQREDLIRFLRTVIPEFSNLTVTPDPSGKYAQLQWREKALNSTLSAADLSDGVLRLLILGAICCNPHPPGLICIDEPEIGLHPAVLPHVGGMLRQAAQRSQVIVLTHSPELLYGMPLESIAVLRKEEGNATVVWPKDSELLYNLLTDEIAGEREVDYERLTDAFTSGELDVLG
jgi:predicted ATPase